LLLGLKKEWNSSDLKKVRQSDPLGNRERTMGPSGPRLKGTPLEKQGGGCRYRLLDRMGKNGNTQGKASWRSEERRKGNPGSLGEKKQNAR